ncbi:bZIP transcription factor [Cordyceps fumosorosea ARSEF 2679]|uniref:BZIP transcription factor n=1 Tax=Cordyceps fumosorosea (strain ARSEF 2679) TaxID=1081104 RepID=A0A167XJD1_CORFA|nr:bZIP transcription factor [Cordyceps fumosorosea ARSEF 2679]OAA65041.1 bZIP transcription factor [Cordyceps fumosorosea ARSEF 2679]
MTLGRPVSDESSSSSKSSKRKGTRSVSTLTPSQLARKRANDREAQRAIRARTKEHIERLERELEELRSHQNRDRTLQDLLRRNKALEDELSRLRESMGMSMTSSPYSAPAAYDEQQSAPPHAAATSGSGPIPSPRMSPLASSADYNPLPDYGQHYVAIPGSNVDSWAANVPSHISSTVSSPSSSADDYVSGYIPTSVPTTMMPTSNSLESIDNFRINNMPMQGVPPAVYMQQQQQQSQHQHQQPPPQGSSQGDWPMYSVYYNSQLPKGSEACLSR